MAISMSSGLNGAIVLGIITSRFVSIYAACRVVALQAVFFCGYAPGRRSSLHSPLQPLLDPSIYLAAVPAGATRAQSNRLRKITASHGRINPAAPPGDTLHHLLDAFQANGLVWISHGSSLV